MIITLKFNNKAYTTDLIKPIDISIPIREGEQNPNCYWADNVEFKTIVSGDFVGSVEQGGSVNYQKLTMTPHGNGTHTECYGHLSSDGSTINGHLKNYHSIAELVTLSPTMKNDDYIVLLEDFKEKSKHKFESLIIRTKPNEVSKATRKYSNTNPPYLDPMLAQHLNALDCKHLLIDLPSVDREVDGGALKAHRAFWGFPNNTRKNCTITELIYVPESVPDGLYLLNLQIISLEMDASPSKPVLYKLTEVA